LADSPPAAAPDELELDDDEALLDELELPDALELDELLPHAPSTSARDSARITAASLAAARCDSGARTPVWDLPAIAFLLVDY
jgi:hypothetical protein